MINYSKETNERIYKAVFYHYHMMCNEYGEDNILGIFAIGSMNYGSYNPETSDVDTRLILIPRLEDILSLKPSSINISKDIGNEKCIIQDIRYFFNGLLEQNPYSLETLVAPFFYINPKWQWIWDLIVPNIDEIAHINETHFINSILNHIQHLLINITLTPKEAYHCERWIIVCKKYLTGQSLRNCIQLDKNTQQYLNKIKFNNISINKAIPFYEKIKPFQDFVQNNNNNNNNEIEKQIYQLFTQILKIIFIKILSREEDYNVTITKIHKEETK